jgi:hypothetical protein
MLDPHARLKGCDLSDRMGTVQVVNSIIAAKVPLQCTFSGTKVGVVADVLIVMIYPVIGEPPVGGAVQEITTFGPLIA